MGRVLCKSREVVIARVSFEDPTTKKTSYKRRPVLIISNNEYNKRSNSVIICPITTNIRNWSWLYAVQLTKNDLLNGSLVNSELRVDGLHNLPKTSLIKHTGFLKKEKYHEAIFNLIKLTT